MFNWKTVEQQIKKNLPSMNISNVKIRNLNPNFEQTSDLKTFFENYYPEMDMDIMTAQIQKEQNELQQKSPRQEKPDKQDKPQDTNTSNNRQSRLDIIANQIVELPSQLMNVLPDSEVLYMYGVPRADSFLMSIALIVNKNFLFFDNKKKKDDYIRDMKTQLTMCLKDYFTENNYRLLGINKGNMENELFSENELSDFNRMYVANYYKVNIIIINLVNHTYQITSVWNEEYPVVIMINENDVYLPILNNKGENVFKIGVLKPIQMAYEEYENPLVELYHKKVLIKKKKLEKRNEKFQDLAKFVNPEQESESESEDEPEGDGIDTESEPEIEIDVKYEIPEVEKKTSMKKSLKKYNKNEISKMTMIELKDVAKDLNISLSKGSKKKRKGELVSEILESLEE